MHTMGSVCVRIGVAALGCVAFLAGDIANATYGFIAERFEMRVKEAELVIRGRVRGAEVATYLEHGERVRCGITYAIDVLNTYKGRSQQQLKFSVYGMAVRVPSHKVNVGDDLLLLLYTEPARSDPASTEMPDVILGEPSREKAKCLDQLATLRLDRTDGAFPLIHESDQNSKTTTWLAYTQSRTTVSDIPGEKPYAKDCRGEMCEKDGRRMVPWGALEQKIKEWSRTR